MRVFCRNLIDDTVERDQCILYAIILSECSLFSIFATSNDRREFLRFAVEFDTVQTAAMVELHRAGELAGERAIEVNPERARRAEVAYIDRILKEGSSRFAAIDLINALSVDLGDTRE